MAVRRPSWFDPALEEGLDPLAREAITWFNRLSADRVSEDDRKSFTAWVNRDPAHAAAFQEIEELWRGVSKLPEARRRRRKAVTRRTLGKSAIALMLGGASWSVYRSHPFADYRTGVGERLAVDLPDGSRANLAACTAIGLHHSSAERRISLYEGEAFFEVAPLYDRPFIVEAGGGRVTALGTAFAVSDRDDRVTVTVTQHTVRIDVGARQVRVDAGLQSSFDSVGSIAEPTQVDGAQELAWMQGRLVFVNARLDRVVAAINRWRRGQLVILNSALAARPVTLIVNLEDIDGALHQLEDALPLSLTSVTPYLTLLYAL